jgi:hypothetical protein
VSSNRTRRNDRAHGHAGVDLVGETDADRVAELLLDLRSRRAHLLPGPGAAGQADLTEEVLTVVHGVGGEGRRERVVLLRLRVVRALDAEVDRLAHLPLELLVDVRHVHRLLLERGRRPVEEEEVVPLLGGHLGGRARIDAGDADVVDGDIGVVLGSPLLDELLVEPLIVGRDEVDPLEDLERLPGGARPSGNDERRAEARPDGGAGDLEELTAIHMSLCHTPTPLS